MFDIGFWELALIAIIGLLVAGPERLPGFAREAGRWVRRIRNMTSEARRELERELDWNDDDSDNSVAGLKRRLSDVERELTGDDEDNDNSVSGLKRRLKEMDRMMKEKPDHQSGKKKKYSSLVSSSSEQRETEKHERDTNNVKNNNKHASPDTGHKV